MLKIGDFCERQHDGETEGGMLVARAGQGRVWVHWFSGDASREDVDSLTPASRRTLGRLPYEPKT